MKAKTPPAADDKPDEDSDGDAQTHDDTSSQHAPTRVAARAGGALRTIGRFEGSLIDASGRCGKRNAKARQPQPTSGGGVSESTDRGGLTGGARERTDAEYPEDSRGERSRGEISSFAGLRTTSPAAAPRSPQAEADDKSIRAPSSVKRQTTAPPNSSSAVSCGSQTPRKTTFIHVPPATFARFEAARRYVKKTFHCAGDVRNAASAPVGAKAAIANAATNLDLAKS